MYNLGKGVVFKPFPRVLVMEYPKLDREALRARLLVEFERTLNAVSDAVDSAPDGAWIEASEEPCRAALDGFRQAVYEAALQAKVDAAEAAFSPSAQRGEEDAAQGKTKPGRADG